MSWHPPPAVGSCTPGRRLPEADAAGRRCASSGPAWCPWSAASPPHSRGFISGTVGGTRGEEERKKHRSPKVCLGQHPTCFARLQLLLSFPRKVSSPTIRGAQVRNEWLSVRLGDFRQVGVSVDISQQPAAHREIQMCHFLDTIRYNCPSLLDHLQRHAAHFCLYIVGSVSQPPGVLWSCQCPKKFQICLVEM